MKNFFALLALLTIGLSARSQCNADFLWADSTCTVDFIDNSTGSNLIYNWDFGDGNSSQAQNPSHFYGTTGTYTVSLQIVDTVTFCVDFVTYTVWADCTPACQIAAAYSQDTTSCEYTFNATGPGINFVSWDFGDGNTATGYTSNHTYASTGTYTVTAVGTDGMGCFDTTFLTVTNNCTQATSCDASFTFVPAGCDGFTFVPVTTGPSMAYSWDFGDGNSSTMSSPNHVYISNGVYVVTLTVFDFNTLCSDSYTLSVTVNCSTPCTTDGAFVWSMDTTTCEVQFVSTAFGGVAPYTYSWDFGDGQTSNQPHPTHQYPDGTTWTPSLTITDATGCDTTIYDVVTVNCATCSGYWMASAVNQNNCNEFQFNATTNGGWPNYFWDFGDGGTATGCCPQYTYATDGNYTIYVTVYDSLSGCSDVDTLQVTANCGTSCDAQFTYTFIDCDSVWFYPVSMGPQYDYFWDFGDGATSTASNPAHEYANGVYQVTLTLIDSSQGCSDTFTMPALTINCTTPCTLDAGFTWVDSNCYAGFYPVETGAGISHYWEFGDGNTSSSTYGNNYYSANGSYQVMHIVWDGSCSDTSYMNIFVNGCTNPCNVYGVMTWFVDTTTCEVVFTANATGGNPPYTYSWNFGDGNTATGQTAINQYPNGSTWTPSLTITDAGGCDTTIYDVVTVSCMGSCTATFNPIQNTCDSWSFYPSQPAGPNVHYYWDFGDGNNSTANIPTNTYASNGTYVVTLTVIDSNTMCSDTWWYTIMTNCTGTCDAQFTYTQMACDSVWFYPVSMGPQYDYIWNFGDGTYDYSSNPTHVYAANGTYQVTLTLIDSSQGCSDTFTMPALTVNCGGSCTVDGGFAWWNDTTNCSVIFTSTAFGGIAPYTYFWNFGDGTTSTLANPSHTFINGSTSTVSLTITDAMGCDTTIYDLVYVQCNPAGCDVQITHMLDSMYCGAYFVSSTSGGSNWTYLWDFGDGSQSTDANPYHYYGQTGSHQVNLWVYDSVTQCMDSAFMWVTTNCIPNCNAGFTWSQTGCDVFNFAPGYSGPAVSYYWNFGDGSTSTVMTPSHTYSADGTYTVYLTVIDSATMCSDSYTVLLNVNCGTSCNLDASFIAQDSACSVYFSPTGTITGVTHTWDFGDGNTSTSIWPTHNYASNGTYIVYHTVSDSVCSDIDTLVITVSGCTSCNMVATFTSNVNDSIVYFYGMGTGGTMPYTYLWDFGDGGTSNAQNPVHYYSQNGVYTVCLTVTDALGCSANYCYPVTINYGSGGGQCDAQFTWVDSNCMILFYPVQYNGVDHYWEFGDGTTSTDPYPAHTYANGGSYTVVHYVTDSTSGCYQAYTQTIVVTGCGSCQAQFTYYMDTVNCGVQFYDLSAVSNAMYSWDFGDGTWGYSASPFHQYSSNGTYTVTLTVFDSITQCSSSYTDIVTVNCSTPSCQSVFTWYPDSTGCGVIFTAAPADNYYWDFGDGTWGSNQTEVHTYSSPGTYTVQLTVWDSTGWCADTTWNVVTVNCSGTSGLDESSLEVSVYPNPSNGTFFVNTNSEVSIIVLDMSGRRVLHTRCDGSCDNFPVDLNALESGAYLMEISDGSRSRVERLIKN